MRPPSHVCRELARLNSRYRLAWCGQPPREEGELNPGHFAIIELLHHTDYGTHDAPRRLAMAWDVEMDTSSWDGVSQVPMHRIYRGPIFQADGSVGRDWNDTEYTPVIAAYCTPDFDLTHEDVYNGRFLDVVRGWMFTTMMERARQQAKEERAYIEDQINDIVGDAVDYWKFEASKADQRGIPIAKKHYREDLKRWEAKQEQLAEKALDQMAPLPPGSS